MSQKDIRETNWLHLSLVSFSLISSNSSVLQVTTRGPHHPLTKLFSHKITGGSKQIIFCTTQLLASVGTAQIFGGGSWMPHTKLAGTATSIIFG